MKIFGYCILVLPFLSLFVGLWVTWSLRDALGIYLIVTLVCVLIAFGVYLITEGK